jgi:hypothetical protein
MHFAGAISEANASHFCAERSRRTWMGFPHLLQRESLGDGTIGQILYLAAARQESIGMSRTAGEG